MDQIKAKEQNQASVQTWVLTFRRKGLFSGEMHLSVLPKCLNVHIFLLWVMFLQHEVVNQDSKAPP